ncbi:bacteriophage N4 receptor [Escherichia coli]|nr:bacteriophage N4 receptor [Escherichia coli]
MKENNLNRVIGWSGLLLTSLLSTSALADNIGTSAEELGLSDYRHFVIYPRLDKALKAQKNNDEATGFAPIFPDTCYHLTHYWLAAVDIPVASDNPVHYADAIRYNARTPLQGSLLPLTRLVWA